jgi:hypothetical protein
MEISDVSTNIFVEYGMFTARAFNAVFRQGEIPQTLMSDNTGGIPQTSDNTEAGPVKSSASIPSSGPQPFGGVSERTAAGIGIGAALGVLSLSGFGFLLCHRRSRRRKRQQQATIEEPSDELRTELHNDHKVEMYDETVAARELDTPHKLDCVVIDSAEPVELDVPVEVEVPEKVDTPEGVEVPERLEVLEEVDAPVELDAPEEPGGPENVDTPEGMDAPAELDTEERLDHAGEILKKGP